MRALSAPLRLATLLAAVLGAACASAGGGDPAPTRSAELVAADGQVHRVEQRRGGGGEFEVGVEPARVRTHLPAVYASLGLEGAALGDAREFGVAEVVVRRRVGSLPLARIVECGARAGMPNADRFTVRLRVVTRLEPGPGGTRMRTLVDASGREPGSSEAPVHCASTGELERRIERGVTAALAAG
jgi:hypothetical protein